MHQGIGGEVEFDLEEPAGQPPRKLRVPVSLTLRQLAPVALGVATAGTAAAGSSKQPPSVIPPSAPSKSVEFRSSPLSAHL